MADLLPGLRALSLSHVFVHHEPHTPRYDRAASKLKYLIHQSHFLGLRQADALSPSPVEIAVWAPSPDGRGPGFYGCFRLFLSDGQVALAQLFAFYDGSEKSVSLKSLESARAYALYNHFGGGSDDQP